MGDCKKKVLFMVFHPNAFGLYEHKIYKTCVRVRVCVCVNLRVSIIRSMIIHSRPLSLSSFVSHYEYNPFSSITYHPWIIASSPHLQALLEQKSGVPSQIMTICYLNKWYPPLNSPRGYSCGVDIIRELGSNTYPLIILYHPFINYYPFLSITVCNLTIIHQPEIRLVTPY